MTRSWSVRLVMFYHKQEYHKRSTDNFSLQYQYIVKQTGDENKENRQLGDIAKSGLKTCTTGKLEDRIFRGLRWCTWRLEHFSVENETMRGSTCSRLSVRGENVKKRAREGKTCREDWGEKTSHPRFSFASRFPNELGITWKGKKH